MEYSNEITNGWSWAVTNFFIAEVTRTPLRPQLQLPPKNPPAWILYPPSSWSSGYSWKTTLCHPEALMQVSSSSWRRNRPPFSCPSLRSFFLSPGHFHLDAASSAIRHRIRSVYHATISPHSIILLCPFIPQSLSFTISSRCSLTSIVYQGLHIHLRPVPC